jgi:hypothetical protein
LPRSAIRIAIAKADCYRRNADIIERALGAAPNAAASLRAAGWLELGAAQHDRRAWSAASSAPRAGRLAGSRSCEH